MGVYKERFEANMRELFDKPRSYRAPVPEKAGSVFDLGVGIVLGFGLGAVAGFYAFVSAADAKPTARVKAPESTYTSRFTMPHNRKGDRIEFGHMGRHWTLDGQENGQYKTRETISKEQEATRKQAANRR